MPEERIKYLFHTYFKGSPSLEERKELLSLIRQTEHEQLIRHYMKEAWTSLQEKNIFTDFEQDNLVDKILAANSQIMKPLTLNTPPRYHVQFLKTLWFRYAAIILLILGVSTYLWFNHTSLPANSKNPINPSSDIAAVSNKATLTLADGTTILLDSAANGNLAQQGNAQVVKLANGQIAYNLNGLPKGEVMLNTMSTPKGGQYQLTLPDGTKVWLNAASSITYPAVFGDKSRPVKVTGEVYFEVAQNKQKPFLVDVDGKSLVEVLGTQFNVNSYKNEEAIKTTLVDGSVKVSDGVGALVLEPGQQAQLLQGRSLNKVNNVNLEQVLAWKNGFINLEGNDLQEVMKQLERWYDIDVRYEGAIPSVQFKGGLGKNVPLSDVQRFLLKLEIKTKREGRTLTVIGE